MIADEVKIKNEFANDKENKKINKEVQITNVRMIHPRRQKN